MGRKLAFDRDQALERAMHAFWRQGYSNTSLRDLLAAMEIGEGSFYNLFGSKKALYRLCMERYNNELTARRLAALAAPATAREGLEAFFRVILDDLADPETPRICLMAGSLSQDVLAEAELQEYVLAGMALFETAFIERLERARAAGEIPPDLDIHAAAGVIVTYVQGFFRVIRVLKSRAEMERQIGRLLDSIGLRTIAAPASIR